MKKLNYIPMGKYIFLLIGIGLFGLYTLSIAYPPFSAFPAILGNCGIGFLILYVIDRFIYPTVNTFEEIIIEKNIAYVLHLLCYATIIGAAIIAT